MRLTSPLDDTIQGDRFHFIKKPGFFRLLETRFFEKTGFLGGDGVSEWRSLFSTIIFTIKKP